MPKVLMNGPEIQKSILAAFWLRFNGKRNKGVGFSKEDKLDALVELANRIIPYHTQQALGERRTKFDAAKTKLHPWRRFGNCFACLSPATARHHIIQLQNGGINSKKNVISLCDECHEAIHPWLARSPAVGN